jgi:hypothetical protein
MYEDIPKNLALTSEELEALPSRAREYIAALEKRLESYRNTLDSTADELRRKRFAYWNR